MLVRESISFQRGGDPKDALGIGKRYLIEKWLEEMGILDTCDINDDLTIDSTHNIKLSHKNLIKFPDYIQFNRVDAFFSVQNNNLISLNGCPIFVKSMFSCSNNDLESLEGCPKFAGSFWCHSNEKQFTKKDVLEYCDVSPYEIHLKIAI